MRSPRGPGHRRGQARSGKQCGAVPWKPAPEWGCWCSQVVRHSVAGEADERRAWALRLPLPGRLEEVLRDWRVEYDLVGGTAACLAQPGKGHPPSGDVALGDVLAQSVSEPHDLIGLIRDVVVSD